VIRFMTATLALVRNRAALLSAMIIGVVWGYAVGNDPNEMILMLFGAILITPMPS